MSPKMSASLRPNRPSLPLVSSRSNQRMIAAVRSTGSVARRLQSPISLGTCNVWSPLYRVVLGLIVVDGITKARAAIGTKAKETFDDIQASFTERLATTRAKD